MQAKPYWRSVDENEVIHAKEVAEHRVVEGLILGTDWPCVVEYSLDNVGESRLVLRPEHDARADALRALLAICVRLFGPMKRFLRPETGTFAWWNGGAYGADDKRHVLSLPDGTGFRVIVIIEDMNAVSPQCTLRKVKKEVEVFEADCKGADGAEAK